MAESRPWPGQNPSAAPHRCHGHQHGAGHSMVGGDASGQNTPVSFCRACGVSAWRRINVTSPTVSWLGLGQPLRYPGGASTAVRRLDFGRPRTAVTSAAINAWIKRWMCSRTTASNPSQIRFDVETCRVVCYCVAVSPFMAGLPSSGRGDSRGYTAFPLFPYLLVIPPRQTHIHGN